MIIYRCGPKCPPEFIGGSRSVGSAVHLIVDFQLAGAPNQTPAPHGRSPQQLRQLR